MADFYTPGSGGGGVVLPYTSGGWYQTCEGANYTHPSSADVLALDGITYFMPFVVSAPVTFKAIGLFIQAGGNTGLKARLGIYKDSGLGGTPLAGMPKALVVDAGQAPADSSVTGTFQSLTIDESFTPGRIWPCVCFQGYTSLMPEVDIVQGPSVPTVPLVSPEAVAFEQAGLSVVDGQFLAGLPNPEDVSDGAIIGYGNGIVLWLQAA